jgi:predicted anti-sigma-YlaC factor YlaD
MSIDELLGPEGSEIGCEECFARLDEFVELELELASPAEADRRVPGMREHLKGCPACREEHDSLRDLLSG